MIKSAPARERCRSQAEQSVRFYFQVREFVRDLPVGEGLPRKGVQSALERAQVDACEALLLWGRANGTSEPEEALPGPAPGEIGDEEVDWIRTCELPYLGA